MKVSIFLFLIASAKAITTKRGTGVDEPNMMYNQAPHWRKNWPEGVIDNGDDDADIIS